MNPSLIPIVGLGIGVAICITIFFLITGVYKEYKLGFRFKDYWKWLWRKKQ